MFDSKDSANEFLKYLNGCHNSIKFTIEFEQADEISFLDILSDLLNAAQTTLLLHLFTRRRHLLDSILNGTHLHLANTKPILSAR